MRLPKQHRSNQAVLVTTLLVLLCCALPVRAEDTKPTSAAGTDFYFTFLDHWRGKKTNDGQQQMDAIVCATKQTSVTVKGSNGYTRSYSINENSSQVIPLTSAVSPLEGIHIQTTEPCYATAWVHGSTCASESAILPKHLLGTLYMLQGTPGDIIELDYVPTKTYSQFTVVGTEDGTTVTIKVKVPLTCVTTGKEIDPQASFTLAANQVLLFQPGDHTQDISGTIVESDKPVAVFQGNNLTRIPVEVKWTDYTWEQARPVSSWGKEFFIPKCTKLQHNIAQITAFYDNTVVSYRLNGMNFLKEMQSGESWELSLTNPVNQLQVVHVQASQPVCCYLYLTGCTENDEIGDPSMAEIVPVDNWATEARFGTSYNNNNTPYSSYLFVTTKEGEKDYIKIDGSTISAYSAQKGGASVVTDGYVTYQIPVAQNGGAVLKAEKGGFSAYLLKLGNVAEAAAFNISLPYTVPEEELCMEGTLLFREDFGGNDPNDPIVGTEKVQGMSYTQISNTEPKNDDQDMRGGRYLVTKRGYHNGGSNSSQWHIQDDHTHPGDYTRGYFLEIDGSNASAAFYSKTINGLCAGTKLTFSAYVANVMTWGMYVGNPPGVYAYPRLKFVLTDPDGNELKSYDTGNIPYDPGPDSSYVKNRDNLCWQNSAQWYLKGMPFTVPENVDEVTLTIYNATENSNGNDFALDDIEIRLCVPPVKIVSEPEACEGSPHTLKADFTNNGSLAEPLEYKWYFSADSLTWTELPEKTGTLTYAKCQKTEHEGWYRAAVADSENIAKENCRAMSEPFRLRVKDDCEPPKEELCMDGTLLFREDFGGNDPNDPRIQVPPEGEKSTVPGMSDSYRQLTTDAYPSMGSGRYLVTKSGYCNGDTTGWTLPNADLSGQRSQWYIQDDHTYPDDYSRGYFLEIDGSGGNQQFYETEISGLCAGSELTFSAYVANVFTWFQYDWYTRNRGPVIAPCLKFVLTNPQTGETLVEKNMQQIPFAEDLAVKTDWQYSSPWYLVGMNFTVPVGVEAIQLSIYNNVTNDNGNDFALDDIEIRLCAPPVTIEGPNEVCLDAKPTLTAHFDNDGTFSNPDYQWYFSTDSAGFYNEIDPAMALTYTIENAQKADEGWYRIGISERGQMAYMNCRAISEPFHLTVKECEPPEPDPDLGLCNNGILLFREDFGGNDPSDPDVNCDLTEGVRYRNACQTPDNIEEGHYLITKRGKGYYENQWLERDDHTYPNDFSRGYYLVVNASNNRLFYSIELPGGESGSEFSFSAYVISLNESIFGDEEGTYYRYPSILFDFVNGSTFERIAAYPVADIKLEPSVSHSKRWHLVGTKFTLPKDIPYIVLNAYTSMIGRMGNDFGLDDIEFRLCRTPIEQHADTTVCDTLLPLDWRGRLWENEGTLIDTLRYTDGEDSVYIHISLHTKNCCQEAQLVKADTTLCGYALPFVWHDAVFDRPSTQTVIEKNERGCDTFVYTLTVDTVYCVRRYPIIVNKYNWVLLVDNIAVRRLFPDKTPVAYQWYKDDGPIAGATEDDYSEQNELHGVFSMLLHFADGSSVWSNIIDLSQTPTAAPVRVKAYNSSGILVREWQATEEQGGLSLPPGIYLLRYEGGDEVFTEKRIVP